MAGGAAVGGQNMAYLLYGIWQMTQVANTLKFLAGTSAVAALANVATTAMGVPIPMLATASSTAASMASTVAATAATVAPVIGATVAKSIMNRREKRPAEQGVAALQQEQLRAAMAQMANPDPRPVSSAAVNRRLRAKTPPPAASQPQTWPKPPRKRDDTPPRSHGAGRLETPESLHLQPKAKAKAKPRAKGGARPRARKIELTKPIMPYHDIMNDGYYIK
jgi:hypothetical protein